MNTLSEAAVEHNLMAQLNGLGYASVAIDTEATLIANMRTQIAAFNGLSEPFTDEQWQQIEAYLSKGSVFERSQHLQDACVVAFDQGKTSKNIRFISPDATQNIYQITHQYQADHRATNGRHSRFDVTLLINGLPLVQIELKKPSIEIAEAFHQVRRYTREAYLAGKGWFGLVQLFVISNGIETRYFSSGTDKMLFTFPWANEDNEAMHELEDFAAAFLNPTHITAMLTQYMVRLVTDKTLMVLRPYQIYAVQKIVERVKTSNQYGYIWHTTGSGKTLTSFKASQIIMNLPEVEKVLFVVDRNDLNTQTVNEFNSFKKDSVDTTDKTHQLVEQLGIKHDKLIVTTLQKLNRAIKNERYIEQIGYLQDKKVVFIFDECHRSQFGDTHRNIKRFFPKAQMFGFTGTPISETNALMQNGLKLTTDYLFEECLHSYTIVNAIQDKNVLPFKIDYRGKFTATGMEEDDTDIPLEQIEGIDTQELFDNPQRLEKITRFIIKNHDIKTRSRDFTAMFCVSSVKTLIQYYEWFEKIQAEKAAKAQAQNKPYKPLVVATIFSYAANEAVESGNQEGEIAEEAADVPSQIDQSSRDHLERYIQQYNQRFGTDFNSGDKFYAYYRDIAKKVKERKVDVLLVVNMFLTGFDSKPLNTLYVDKKLQYHGLIQAFSRTNRLHTDRKTFGNIVCFRNLKQATDAALRLFGKEQDVAKTVLMPTFEAVKQEYNAAAQVLLDLVPEAQAVEGLVGDEAKLEYVKAFRTVMRFDAQLQNFIEYEQDQTLLNKEQFQDFAQAYQGIYQDLKKRNQRDKETLSVLGEIDFQLDLLHSDQINVAYLLSLLQLSVNAKKPAESEQYQAQVRDLMASDVALFDKQDLIEKFIQEQVPKMLNGEPVPDVFAQFWEAEKQAECQKLCEQERYKPEVLQNLLGQYEYTQRFPRVEEVKDLIDFKLPLLKRESGLQAVLQRTHELIKRFYVGMS